MNFTHKESGQITGKFSKFNETEYFSLYEKSEQYSKEGGINGKIKKTRDNGKGRACRDNEEIEKKSRAMKKPVNTH